MNDIRRKIWEANVSPDSSALQNYINHLSKLRSEWDSVADHYGRTLLHAAVEEGDSAMVKVLLSAGCNVNACEGYGATPLVLAVLKRNLDLCRILVENCAVYGEIFFVKVPSPFTNAQRLGEDAIVQLFQERTEQNQTFLDELIGKDKGLQESQGSQQKKGGQATAEFVYDRTNIKSNPLCWRQEH